MRIAPLCYLLTASNSLTLVTIQNNLRMIHTFFLTYYRGCVIVAWSLGKVTLPALRLYVMKKSIYNIAFDTLTTPDVERWDYDTRKIVCEAVTPIIQEETKEYVEKPMAALHGIVKKLVNNRDVLDNEANIRKLRFAYNGLAFALGYKLEGKKSYPIVEDSDYHNV